MTAVSSSEGMGLFVAALFVLAAAAGLSALVALLPRTRSARIAGEIGPWGAVLGCLCGLIAVLFGGPWAGTCLLDLDWGALPLQRFQLGLDPLSRVFLLPVFGLGLACALSGRAALRHAAARKHSLGAHWCFYLLLILGMALVMSARNGMLFVVAWEIMSLAPFFLIDFNDGERSVRDASWVYLTAAHLGGVFVLAFFALAGRFGSIEFSALVSLGLWDPQNTSLLFLLALIGFGAKIGLAPLHVWLPEAHPAAPSHVSALLSGAMLNAGLYGLLRVFDFLGTPEHIPGWWGRVLLFAGLASALTGILKAAAQSNLKRLLAYSSVENMGLMIMGTGAALMGAQAGDARIAGLAYAGVLFHMLNHSAFKGLLFLCAGEVLHSSGTVNMAHLGGLQKRMPAVGAAFALGAASIACLPPFNGFAGEFVLALGLAEGLSANEMDIRLSLSGCLAALGLIGGLAAAVFAKAYSLSFLGEPRSAFSASAASPGAAELWPLALPASVCLLGGIASPLIFEAVIPAACRAGAYAGDLLTAVGPQLAADVTPALDTTALVGLCGTGLVAVLILLRRRLLRKAGERTSAVWGCGYRYGTPRIQYTDASFSEPTAALFGPAMGVKVRRTRDDGYFPGPTSLEVSAPDRLRSGLFTPLFEGVERVCNALKIVQHGRIHLYILYILAVLVALLVWGVRP